MSAAIDAGPPAFATILDIVTSPWRPRSLAIAVRLGIPELLEQGPRDVSDIAAATGTVPDHLYRLLRALARDGVLEEGPLRTFGLTDVSRALLPHAPDSMRSMVLWLSSPWMGKLWEKLEDAIRSEASAFHGLFGTGIYQYLREHPAEGDVFHGAMEELARLAATPVAMAFDFSRFGTVVDVGGGTGEQIAAILKRHPGVRGILIDGPEIMERARRNLARHGVDDRCELRPGDLFEAVPRGGDVYILKNIVHDLSDEHASALLARCREAMQPGGAVIVVQDVVPDLVGHYLQFLDLQLLLSGAGGKERTRAEFERLFAAGGLRTSEIVQTPAFASLIIGVA